MEHSSQPADALLRLKAVDAVYGGVLDPRQYGELIQAVNAIFDDAGQGGGDVSSVSPQLAALGPHVANALRLFEIAHPESGNRLMDFLNAKPFAAMAATEAGRVVLMNDTARGMLGGLDAVADLPLRADAHGDVKDFLSAVAGADGRRPPLVVGGWHPTEDRALLFVLEVVDTEWRVFSDIRESQRPKGPVILVKSTETRMSRHVWDLIEAAFGLTTAELDVVRELANGRSVKEISRRRARSINTVKTQLMTVLRKTGTRSQAQLLCIVTALAHVARSDLDATPRDPLRTPERGNASLHSVDLPEGKLKYVLLGAGKGTPVLLLAPTNRPDFTAAIVDALADHDLLVVCPVRPGSWGTDRWPKWEPRRAARVYLSLIDRLSLGRVTLAGLRTGAPYAVELARQAPERFSQLVMIDTGAPLVGMSRFAAMPPWPRTLYTTARLFPELLLLPFRYSASDFFASPEGESRAIHTFYRDSPIDLALLKKPEFYEIARRNLAYYFENPDHVARDIGYWVRDWSAELHEVIGRMPVHFLHGGANPSFAADDIRELCRRSPGVSASIIEDAAMLLVYERPELLAKELRRRSNSSGSAS
jgi:pimeloyl-ACP methyl ester carboxylesterase/DNA-binding CsgD family transcriptional regulator